MRVEPHILDENLIAEFIGEERIELSDREDNKPKINLNGEWVTLELGDRKPPFSARITARKP